MEDFLIDEDSVLERVDEYTLYCHYLEFQPDIKVNYLSPLRADDDNPSFGIFPCRKAYREFMWKDSGGKGDSGDIIKLVQLLFGYKSRYEALARIKSDFGLGITVPQTEKIVRYRPTYHTDCDIRLRSRNFYQSELDWWKQFNISPDILSRYRTGAVYMYWMSPSQKAPFFPGSHSFVYRVYDRYQLYFPTKPREYKFRNDMKPEHVLGFQQLTYTSDTLIITKSMKDVMCLRSFGYEAVSPRSENTPLPEQAIGYFNVKYKRKFILFDNDMKHRGDWYPYPQVYVPIESGSKDISDFTRDHGPQAASELLQTIIG
jgi:hypothetical protein